MWQQKLPLWNVMSWYGMGFISLISKELIMKKVMRLIDSTTGLMECKVCGKRVFAKIQSRYERLDGKSQFYRGSWQCLNGCKIQSKEKPRQ